MPNFNLEKKNRINTFDRNRTLKKFADGFTKNSLYPQYSYNFNWLGLPIIQYPQDIVAVQEIIWEVKPDLIIETGIARGGSLILSASMLYLLEMFDKKKLKEIKRKVIGVDIDIRKHNKKAIKNHPLYKKIKLLQGSSVDQSIIKKIKSYSSKYNKIMVFLDSNHTHEHVFEELVNYSPMVTVGSYCVVFDTIVENLPKNFIKNRPWNKGNNPKTAIKKFLKGNNNFIIDNEFNKKLLISMNPDGYLKKIK